MIEDNESLCFISKHGIKIWKNSLGQLHRLDGPAIEYPCGENHWYINGKRHRINGPAIEYADGAKEWYVNGNPHRTDGPAIEFVDEEKLWFIDGIDLTKEEFTNWVENNGNEWNEEIKLFFKMSYS